LSSSRAANGRPPLRFFRSLPLNPHVRRLLALLPEPEGRRPAGPPLPG
jgi:hypothetical protein